MTSASEQTGAWLEDFSRIASGAPWLQKLRERAFARFAEIGFPTTRNEEWRFTNVAPIARTKFQAQAKDWDGGTGGFPVEFLNGRFVGAALPKGARLGTPEDIEKYLTRYAFIDANGFAALNAAMLNDVAAIVIERGAVIEEPIRFLFGSRGTAESPVAAHPRVLILAGPHSQSSFVEMYVGGGTYLTNTVTEIVAGDGAVLDHCKVQTESASAFHVATLQAQLGRSAAFTSHNISIGGALVRNDINVVLSEGSDAALNGLYLAGGSQHVDNHTSIDHAFPHGTSREVYKGILDGKASAVFNGRVIVRKDAQKTDSKQTNKNLVLSDDAVIDTKPELQIFADDVRCTHGATIGQLDAEALFYLQSRGIGKQEARSLLTFAFAQDIVDQIRTAPIRDWLGRLLLEKFHERAH